MQPFPDPYQVVTLAGHCVYIISRERTRYHSVSCFSSYMVNSCPFHSPLSAMFSTLLCVLLLFETTSKHSAGVLSSDLKHKKAELSTPGESACVDKLHPGMSYNAVGCEFNVNESTIYEDIR